MIKAAAGLLMAVLVAASLVMGVGHWYRAAPASSNDQAKVVELAAGQGVSAIADQLQRAGVLDHPRLWELCVRFTDRARHLKAGEYAIAAHATPLAITEQLTSGRVLLHAVTLVEGWTLRQVLAGLSTHDFLQHDLSALPLTEQTATIQSALGLSGAALEGEFFPDTYSVPRHTTELSLLRLARERLSQQLNALWEQRATDLQITTPQQALVLASLIEKETASRDERALISAVFNNRLARGMRLQTDPTVIYGLGTDYQGRLHKADLERDTPYNTYTRAGLPPTPIALPGRESLLAALHPATSDALYFVAIGDGSGRHVFTRTLAEHQQAVREYLQRLRQRAESGDTLP